MLRDRALGRSRLRDVSANRVCWSALLSPHPASRQNLWVRCLGVSRYPHKHLVHGRPGGNLLHHSIAFDQALSRRCCIGSTRRGERKKQKSTPVTVGRTYHRTGLQRVRPYGLPGIYQGLLAMSLDLIAVEKAKLVQPDPAKSQQLRNGPKGDGGGGAAPCSNRTGRAGSTVADGNAVWCLRQNGRPDQIVGENRLARARAINDFPWLSALPRAPDYGHHRTTSSARLTCRFRCRSDKN